VDGVGGVVIPMTGERLTIDLNSDMGEVPAAIADGTQESLMPSLTSVNVACGGHAGDAQTMKTTIEQAMRWKLAIGAHPGYADRENFGRLELKLPLGEIADSVFEQVRALGEIAARCGARVVHVKPHGALYNQAVRNRELAEAIATGVARWRRDVVLVGLAGSSMLEVFRKAGFAVAAEAFADRRYEADGTLRSRKFEDALIRDPAEAARQALGMVERGVVIASDGSEVAVDAQTLCIHGDTPGAPKIAAAVAKSLRDAGVALCAVSP
jgi:5-oxoprolinase (ATP-hydrolysing) subunit A